MADTSSASLDKWREFFRGASSDIFVIIEHAILVAVSDCPCDFKLKRDRIAEMLFTCKATKCFGCDRSELDVANVDGVEKSDEKYKSGIEEGGGSKDTKESKANSSPETPDDDNRLEMAQVKMNQTSNYSYGDAEALTDEIEEEYQFYEEVLRIKEILDNFEEESDELLFDSLRRLQLMTLSVETLKGTEIGKSVNALRKHRVKDIRYLAKILIEGWKALVDAWVAATAAIAGGEAETESDKAYAVEEEGGLPSPPMDEGAFFATPTSMELSQFFDGMDDDGNPRNSGEFNKNRDNGRRPNTRKPDVPKRNPESPNLCTPPLPPPPPPKVRKPEPKRNQEPTLKKQAPPIKPNRHSGGEYGPEKLKSTGGELGPRRPRPPHIQPKVANEMKARPKMDVGNLQRKPTPPQPEANCNNDGSVRMKLEAAKRKLHERYQEAENAKKQRTIQMVELRDLPNQSLAERNPKYMRPGNTNRQWANGRR